MCVQSLSDELSRGRLWLRHRQMIAPTSLGLCLNPNLYTNFDTTQVLFKACQPLTVMFEDVVLRNFPCWLHTAVWSQDQPTFQVRYRIFWNQHQNKVVYPFTSLKHHKCITEVLLIFYWHCCYSEFVEPDTIACICVVWKLQSCWFLASSCIKQD